MKKLIAAMVAGFAFGYLIGKKSNEPSVPEEAHFAKKQ